MKIRRLIFGLAVPLVSLQAAASSTWIDNRYAHITASETNQYKIGVGHTFDNGAGLLASSIYDLGKDVNQFKSAFQEYEGWYPFALDDRWSLSPGMLSDVTSSGTKVAPYLVLNYQFTDSLGVAGRYRYNHMTHRERNLNSDMAYNDSHLFDIFVNWQASDRLWVQFNPEYAINTGEFHAPNGHRAHWEPNVAARYQLNRHWAPYMELGWLDKDQNHDSQVRIRVGVRYYL